MEIGTQGFTRPSAGQILLCPLSLFSAPQFLSYLFFVDGGAIYELTRNLFSFCYGCGILKLPWKGGDRMPPYSVDELRQIIALIAQEHGVKSVFLFGSYSRGTASADSDVDLKIEKGRLNSLFQLSGFRLAVEDALKLSVDLITSEVSDHAFLDAIGRDEVLLYRNS